MYRAIYFFLLSCFLSTVVSGQYSPILHEKMQAGNGPFHVTILLSDKVDFKGLEEEFDQMKLWPEERARRVYQALQQKAAATQQEVINQVTFRRSGTVHFEVKQQYWLVNMMEASVDKEALERLAASDDVAYIKWAGEDRVYQEPPVSEGMGKAGAAPGSTEPGLEAIGAPELWKMGYTGLGQRALIFDSGIMQEHPAVSDQFIYFNRPGLEGWNGIDSYVPRDRPGNHGTHVTGTVLGLDRQTEDTIGVAFNARFMSTDPILDKPPYRKMTDYVGYYQFYFNPDGDTSTFDDVPDVINNSWGLFSLDTALCTNYAADMAEAMSAAGMALVFSAGNNGPGEVTIGRPAFINVDLVTPFATGAVNGSDSTFPIAGFSSRGPSICEGAGGLKIKPEAVAPGVSVRSAFGTDDYDLKSGTSMAAPHVSGAVLLLKEAFPFLTGKEILQALYASAVDLGQPGEDNTYGKGIINLPAAFTFLKQAYSPVPPKERIYDLVVTDVAIPQGRFHCEDSIPITATIANKGDSTAPGLDIKVLNGNAVVDSFTVSQPLEAGAETEITSTVHGISGNIRQEYGIRAEWPVPVVEYDVVDNTRYARFISRSPDTALQQENRYTIDSIEFRSGFFVRENPDRQETWEKTTLENDTTNFVLLLDCTNYLPKSGQNDMIYTPMYQTGDDGFRVALKYAYATKSTFFEDSLIFEMSTDCGQTFDRKLFVGSGGDLVTYGDVSSEPGVQDWVTFDTTVSVDPDARAIFRIRGVNDYGGKIYLDEFVIDPNLSISGWAEEATASINIFPNPASTNLRVVSDHSSVQRVVLLGTDGRQLKEWHVNGRAANLSVGDLPEGLYFLKIGTARQAVIRKFVKTSN